MRKTALSLSLVLALTAAMPAAAAQRAPREDNPNPVVRIVDSIAKRVAKVIKAFEVPVLPHPKS